VLKRIENETRKLIENISDFELERNPELMNRILNIEILLVHLAVLAANQQKMRD